MYFKKFVQIIFIFFMVSCNQKQNTIDSQTNSDNSNTSNTATSNTKVTETNALNFLAVGFDASTIINSTPAIQLFQIDNVTGNLTAKGSASLARSTVNKIIFNSDKSGIYAAIKKNNSNYIYFYNLNSTTGVINSGYKNYIVNKTDCAGDSNSLFSAGGDVVDMALSPSGKTIYLLCTLPNGNNSTQSGKGTLLAYTLNSDGTIPKTYLTKIDLNSDSNPNTFLRAENLIVQPEILNHVTGNIFVKTSVIGSSDNNTTITSTYLNIFNIKNDETIIPDPLQKNSPVDFTYYNKSQASVALFPSFLTPQLVFLYDTASYASTDLNTPNYMLMGTSIGPLHTYFGGGKTIEISDNLVDGTQPNSTVTLNQYSSGFAFGHMGNFAFVGEKIINESSLTTYQIHTFGITQNADGNIIFHPVNAQPINFKNQIISTISSSN